MGKLIKYTFGGANQDISKGKHPFQFYFEAQHIKILSTDTQATGDASNEKGNTLKVSIPDILITPSASTIKYGVYDSENLLIINPTTINYKSGGEIDTQITNGDLPELSTSQIIIGHVVSRDGVVLFTSDSVGMDCIWNLSNVIDGSYTLELLYVRSLSFSINTPIQALFNYENDNIQKVYWVDGVNQIRFINITNNQIEDNIPLIDTPSNTLNFVGTIDLSQPIVTSVNSGGKHTAGMIQYAYNLFRINASQTKLSPVSELIPLDKGANLGGGALNEVVGAVPVIQIDDLDLSYTHIRVYAIKYTSYNEIPSINLIDERELDSNAITVYDDGSTISSLSLEELLFLGSDPITPKHIEIKDNRLFPVNITTKEFVLPDELDCRAYSFPSNSSSTVIYKNIYLNNNVVNGEALTVSDPTYRVGTKHDSINLDYDSRKYQASSTVLGAEGKYIKLSIIQKSLTNPEDYRLLKDREIYRFGIEFYNTLGQKSLPLWITDYKMPVGNLKGEYNTLKVELKSEFYTWLDNYDFDTAEDKPVGYRILRADRTINDRTIICQGILSSMMVNTPRDDRNANLLTTQEKKQFSNTDRKLPNILVRTFQKLYPLQPNSHLLNMQFKSNDPNSTGDTDNKNPGTEIQYDGPVGCETHRKADTYQYTSMYQMYSPEILFDNVNLNTSTQCTVIGGAENTLNNLWGKCTNITTKITEIEGKVDNAISPYDSSGTKLPINGNINGITVRGLIYDCNGSTPDRLMVFNQWNREFKTFIPASSVRTYDIFGAPELTERGQGNTVYNSNSKYTYSNSLEGFLSDGVQGRCDGDGFKDEGNLQRAIISVNSYGAKCATVVLDRGDNVDVDPHTRYKMEDLYSSAGINNTNTALIAELVKPVNDLYFGNIYSGNSYEDKKRTSYISIGVYAGIDITSQSIDSSGDTYVQNFEFTRISKTDTEVYASGINQFTEIVSVLVETTVDLKNRNDLSSSQWDARFQPRYTEYHEYNDVYSQQSTLIKSTDVSSTFRRINNFDTRVQTTKIKIPNEPIDSWTDILVNETMDLDGKYGPINGIIEFKDNLYTFQDKGIAQLSINPRVQVQGNDGVGIELGTGGILYDYNYITTKSGSINKWGLTSTKHGIYYYDALNKGVGKVPGASDILLSDQKGMHTFFNNNYVFSDIKVDNPLLGKGAVFGYDNYNNDVYFTLLQGSKSFTWCYNELNDGFIDLKTYKPTRYISQGEKFIIPSAGSNSLYEQYDGNYNTFFGQTQPSYIILQVNPESDISVVFDSIFFNSELYLNDIDQPDKTITHVQAYNEYQDSGRIPLIVGRNKNLRRKFREWKAEIPRDGRERIRNPWIKLKLELDNTSNYKLVLHDIIISYTV